MDQSKGFGIMPNLTVKRGQLSRQVKQFTETFNHEGSWVDPKTGKILIKLRGAQRGQVIKSTADLVLINSNFKPTEWHFCTPPVFETHNDVSTPANGFNNSSLVFSPVEPPSIPPHFEARPTQYDLPRGSSPHIRGPTHGHRSGTPRRRGGRRYDIPDPRNGDYGEEYGYARSALNRSY